MALLKKEIADKSKQLEDQAESYSTTINQLNEDKDALNSDLSKQELPVFDLRDDVSRESATASRFKNHWLVAKQSLREQTTQVCVIPSSSNSCSNALNARR